MVAWRCAELIDDPSVAVAVAVCGLSRLVVFELVFSASAASSEYCMVRICYAIAVWVHWEAISSYCREASSHDQTARREATPHYCGGGALNSCSR